MEISDCTIIISLIIVVVGWFVNSFLNRRHEISKKRLDFRLESLHSFLPVFLSMTSSLQPFIDDPTLNDKIRTARVNFQLYGLQDEIDLFNKFVVSIEKQNTNEATITINELIGMVRSRLRHELKLPSLRL
ncbi:MAG: hypothetical protein DRP66_07065 [Planctomycetota bacterium]|nr:MAG: hypothetical protein DRP66_07065 [Planctomycetota bacterium]